MPGSLVHVATITGAHGIKGELELRLEPDIPEAILAAALSDNASRRFQFKITGRKKNVLIVHADTISTRNEAEQLKGTLLHAAADALPELEGGGYYRHELIGLKVISLEGEELGEVIGFHNFGAGDILMLRFHGGREEMLPFNTQTFPHINRETGAIALNPPQMI